MNVASCMKEKLGYCRSGCIAHRCCCYVANISERTPALAYRCVHAYVHCQKSDERLGAGNPFQTATSTTEEAGKRSTPREPDPRETKPKLEREQLSVSRGLSSEGLEVGSLVLRVVTGVGETSEHTTARYTYEGTQACSPKTKGDGRR